MATRRDLVERALLREPTDRLPCFPLVDVAFASAHSGRTLASLQLDARLHAAALSQCLRELPVDGVYINLCLTSKQAAAAVCSDGHYAVLLDECLRLEFSENEVAAVASSDLLSLDDERMGIGELFHPGMLATFQAMPEEVRDQGAVCVGLTGAFSQVGFLVGVRSLMVAMLDNPDAVHRAVRKRQQIALRQAAELCRAGARFIWIGEGMASNSLLSGRMYAEFALPYEQELADEIRRQGALSLLHICGNVTPSLPHLARSRGDGVDIDSPTDWSAAVEVLGPRLCLKGNINPTLFLPGNEQELRVASATCKRAVGRTSGFILSTGCLVPRDSSREAFNVMARAALTE